MDELTPEAFVSRLPAGVQRPCLDCNGAAMWLDTPAPNGAHIAVVHERGCPGFAATPASNRSAEEPREDNTP